eukprot:scaffold12592_cov120-Isochrysis_galbana.AAC.4
MSAHEQSAEPPTRSEKAAARRGHQVDRRCSPCDAASCHRAGCGAHARLERVREEDGVQHPIYERPVDPVDADSLAELIHEARLHVQLCGLGKGRRCVRAKTKGRVGLRRASAARGDEQDPGRWHRQHRVRRLTSASSVVRASGSQRVRGRWTARGSRASSWTGRVAGPWARTLSHTHPWSSAADGTECTGSHSCGAAVSCRPFWWKPIRGHAGRYKAPDRLWRLGSSVERSAKIGEPAPPKAEGPLYGPRAGATSYAAAGAGEGAGQGARDGRRFTGSEALARQSGVDEAKGHTLDAMTLGGKYPRRSSLSTSILTIHVDPNYPRRSSVDRRSGGRYAPQPPQQPPSPAFHMRQRPLPASAPPPHVDATCLQGQIHEGAAREGLPEKHKGRPGESARNRTGRRAPVMRMSSHQTPYHGWDWWANGYGKPTPPAPSSVERRRGAHDASRES